MIDKQITFKIANILNDVRQNNQGMILLSIFFPEFLNEKPTFSEY